MDVRGKVADLSGLRPFGPEALKPQVALVTPMAAPGDSIERIKASRIHPDLGQLYNQQVLNLPARQDAAAAFQVDASSRILFDGQGRVGIQVTAADPDRLAEQLAPLGFQVSATVPEMHTLEGFLPTGSLPRLSGFADRGLLGVLPLYRPVTNTGSVTSEADFVLEADRTRATAGGPNGSGVTVAAISDSFNNLGGYSNDIATGNLPNNVLVKNDLFPAGGIDEGRAMLQLVHDLAPASRLVFTTGVGGPASMRDEIVTLPQFVSQTIGSGPLVIVDDLTYLFEPFFQDGVIAQAVNTVVNSAGTSGGVYYFSSAGNFGDNSYETTSVGFGGSGQAGPELDFDQGAGVDRRLRVEIPANSQITFVLQWDDPFGTLNGVDTDIDFTAYDTLGNFLGGSFADNIQNQRPVEGFALGNPTNAPVQFDLGIERFAGPNPGRIKFIAFGGGDTQVIQEHETNSSTIFGHAAADQAMAVGAVPWFDQANPEPFSSVGPSTLLFSPLGSPIAPQVRQTPEISATDGTATTVPGFGNFFGTSAAAPHAAAVAALLIDSLGVANPAPAEVYGTLMETADDLGAPGFDNVTGAGVINAYDAVFFQDGNPAFPVAGEAVTPAGFPFGDGFEGEVLSINWQTRTTGAGRLNVTTANSPASGTYHLQMDSQLNGVDSLNEATLHFDATTAAGAPILLNYNVREFGDEDNPMPATFTGSVDADGVALSVDGINWYRIHDLTGGSFTGDRVANLSAIAAGLGLTLGSDVRVKFQQFDNFLIPTDGFAFDDVALNTLTSFVGAEVNPNEVQAPDQRSRVTELAVTVDGALAGPVSASAFSVVRQQDLTTFGVSIAGVTANLDGSTTVLLGFTGAGLEFGSLPDGDYRLVINGDLLLDAAGNPVDIDGDGTPGGLDSVIDFHRFFGDRDGDRDVDGLDLAYFRLSHLGLIGFQSYFDYNGSGAFMAGAQHDGLDIANFRNRLFQKLEPPVSPS
jgi:hypothetical protein